MRQTARPNSDTPANIMQLKPHTRSVSVFVSFATTSRRVSVGHYSPLLYVCMCAVLLLAPQVLLVL